MKQKIKNSAWLVAVLVAACFTSCKVNTLEGVEGIEQKVSLVQTGEGRVTLTPDIMIIDKPNQMVKKAFGLALSGLKGNEGFTADVQLILGDVPEGYEQFNAGEVYLTETENSSTSISSVNVPAGTAQKAFYINISKAAIDAHPGKNMAFKLKLANPSRYSLGASDSTYVLMNTTVFGTLKTDITDQYFKNSTFARQPGTTDRFVNLADWTANDAVTKSRPTGAGYDQNVGFMGIERWGWWDNTITNGKIYQTFTLPAGNYIVDVDMKKVATDEGSYFVVAEGNDLPDAAQIDASIQKTVLNASYNNVPLVMEFKLTEQKMVSIGFLMTLTGNEKLLQASKIKFYKVENLFD